MQYKSCSQAGKYLTEFEEGDKIYIQENIHHLSYVFACRFVEYRGGKVYVVIVGGNRPFIRDDVGREVCAAPHKCFVVDSEGRKIWFGGLAKNERNPYRSESDLVQYAPARKRVGSWRERKMMVAV